METRKESQKPSVTKTFLVGPNHDTKLQSKKVNQITGDHLQISILKVSELGRIN